MREKADRTGRDNRLLIGVVVVLCMVVGAMAAWIKVRMPLAPAEQQAGAPVSAGRVPGNEPLMVTVFVPADGMLSTGTAGVVRQPDTQTQAREALGALFVSPRSAAVPVLRDLKLKMVYIDAAGTAYADLALSNSSKASAWEEFIAVYAVVNTLMQNFEEIKKVRLLLDGREAQTLAGHMDLSRAFTKRMDLVK